MSEAASQTWGSLTWGEATELRPPEPFGSRTCDATLVRWRPDAALGLDTTAGTSVELICCQLHGGERLFVPVGSTVKGRNPYGLFFHQAWVCGFAILEEALGDRLTPEQRYSYRASWFLFRRLHHMRALTTRRFNSMRDFIATGGAAQGAINALLPWLISQSTARAGYPQALDALLGLGHTSAKRAGLISPTNAQRLHYGLASAARIESPERLTGDEILNRVQFAMLANTPDEDRTAKHRSLVEAEILEVIWPHLTSDAHSEIFDLWFQGPKNSFVKQVAQRLHDFEPNAARELVNDVLLTLAFNSQWHVAQCVQAVMRDVTRCLDNPLSPSEQLAFEQLFMPQDYFAGLPLIMLREKLEFCEGILLDLFSGPSNPAAIDAFHRLLGFYGFLVRERRDADARRQRSARGNVEFDEGRDGSTGIDERDEVENREVLTAVLTSIQQSGDFDCSCDESELNIADVTIEAEIAILTMHCKRCGAQQAVSRRLEDLRHFGDH